MADSARRPLAIERGDTVPVPRGPMLNASEIAQQLFDSKVTQRWVRENVPGKMTFGRSTVLWYRDDVLTWIDRRREGAA